MILCIDTASQEAGIALATDQKSFFLSLKTDHASHVARARRSRATVSRERTVASDGILVTIDQLFKKAKKIPADLRGVLIVSGPGSFTSLRVGVAVGNQFAHQLKIPITPLRMDEWFGYRLSTPDFLYLQTMNREEAYVVGHGSYEGTFKQRIVLFSDLLKLSDVEWVGQLSSDHLSRLPKNFRRINDLLKPVEVWKKVVFSVGDANLRPLRGRNNKLALAEPYYGKEPTITKSKKNFKIQ